MNTAICIVCGNIIGWDDEPNPACLTHAYGQVIDAIERMKRKARSNNGVQTDRAHGPKSGKKSSASQSHKSRGG